MLFADDKSDADVLREATDRSEHLKQRINELTAALSAIRKNKTVPFLIVEADVIRPLESHQITAGTTTVRLGVLPDTARPFFRAALDEAITLKNEIDAKLAVARKVLEE